MRYVDVAVFAHNEEESIGFLLADLSRQTLLGYADTNLRIRVLCNACRDQTVAVAQEAIKATRSLSGITLVDDFEQGGKSRTWNRFVSELPDNSDFCIFIDGDIRLPDGDALRGLLNDLGNSKAVAVTSRPLKDVRKLRRKPLLRAAASSISREHKDGPICGQLYAAQTNALRQIRLPVPCLVEDGFLSACLITGLFSHPAKRERVKASPMVSHYFEAPGSLQEFFNHDVRLALGRELNAALYSDLWAAQSIPERVALLQQFSESRGIERSVDEHFKHPERSALTSSIVLRQLTAVGNTDKFYRKILRFPFKLLHCFYKITVNQRAKRLFTKHQFQW